MCTYRNNRRSTEKEKTMHAKNYSRTTNMQRYTFMETKKHKPKHSKKKKKNKNTEKIKKTKTKNILSILKKKSSKPKCLPRK